MASLYDYGLPQLNQNMMSLYSTMQQEKRNKVLENAQNIENTAAMFKLNNEMKREQMLDKDIMFGGLLEAKGTSPRVKDRTIKYLQGLGYADEIGRVKARNIPTALDAMSKDIQYQLGVSQDMYEETNEQMLALDEEINKMREKGDPEKQQEFAAKIMQRENLKVKQYNIKGMMEKLTGRKPDTSLTEAEILSKGGPEAETYIKNKKELEGVKPDEYTDWGYGQKMNKRTKEIIKVPTAPTQGSTGGKAPSGYKWTETGDLEPIPGGPADIKFQTEYAKNYGRLSELESGLDRLKSSAEQLKKHPGLYRITGLYGKVPNIPGSEAANAEALLNTMQAQIGFNVLQNMREMSKTGGALGQVSDLENKKLDRALVALDKTQSHVAFQKALDEIIKYADDGKGRLRGAFEKNYSTQRQSGARRPLSHFDPDK